MEAEHLHIILKTDPEFGVWAWSPQVPGLTFGRATAEEFNEDLDEVLAFADAPSLPRVFHEDQCFTSPDGLDLVVRCARDQHGEARRDAGNRFLASVFTGGGDPLERAVPGADGIRVFVAALADDSLRFHAEQCYETGDIVHLVVAVADGLVWSRTMAGGSMNAERNPTLEQLGLTLDSTVGDLMRSGSGAGSRPEPAFCAC